MDCPCLKRLAGLGFSRVRCHGLYYGTGQCKTNLYKGDRAALRLKHAVYRRCQNSSQGIHRLQLPRVKLDSRCSDG